MHAYYMHNTRNPLPRRLPRELLQNTNLVTSVNSTHVPIVEMHRLGLLDDNLVMNFIVLLSGVLCSWFASWFGDALGDVMIDYGSRFFDL